MEEAVTIKDYYQDPLKIPEVLETVFGYLPLKDLKSSRQVNKQWNAWALSAMKKIPSATVNVWTLEELSELLTCLKTISGGASNFPCSKFYLNFGYQLIPYVYNKCLSNDKSLAEIEVLLSDFFLKISPWVTELKWETTPSKDKEIFGTVFPRKVDFPNLKVLELVHRVHGNETTHKSLRNFNLLVTNILEKAPSLRKFSLKSYTERVDNLVELLVHTKISFFTELVLSGMINSRALKRLSTMDRELKLKSVSLNFWQIIPSKMSIFQFLSSQNGSLEELKLDFRESSWDGDQITVVTFPEIPNLKTLSIDFHTQTLMSFPEISYRRQFPALKTIHFNHVGSPFRSLMNVDVFEQLLNPRMEPVGTIEKLTLPSRVSHVWPLMYPLEIGIFPNVKKLAMEASPAMLRAVFNHLRDLEELTLDCTSSHGSIDLMLTGHDELEIETINERIQKEGDAFLWDQLKLGHVHINQSIATLQKLRILRFRNDLHIKYMEVSKVSLELILSKMGSLKCIDFGARWYPIEAKIDRAWCAKLNKDCILLWSQKEKK